MPIAEKAVRRSVALPLHTARRVTALAQSRRTSSSRLLADLIEIGLNTQESDRERLASLVGKLAASSDAKERNKLKRKLASIVFDE